MEETSLRALIVATGRELLETGLVARTWGNVSARMGEGTFLITPSGRDYEKTEEADIARVNLATMEWTGRCKPSSEKGVHGAAYRCFPECGFVIHTHQTCASALGLGGFERMDVTQVERERLGGLAKAAYGLPGTKKLKNAVEAAMASGAHTVLMEAHGAVICGRSKEETMERARLLEEICRRNLAYGPLNPERAEKARGEAVLAAVKAACPHVALADADEVIALADGGKPLYAQLDDMAQMLGPRVDCVPCEAGRVTAELKKHNGVLVRGLGAVLRAGDASDAEALKLLMEKAAVCALHTAALGTRARLGALDAALMHFVYITKYARQKG